MIIKNMMSYSIFYKPIRNDLSNGTMAACGEL